jgi:hypothetical protein
MTTAARTHAFVIVARPLSPAEKYINTILPTTVLGVSRDRLLDRILITLAYPVLLRELSEDVRRTILRSGELRGADYT